MAEYPEPRVFVPIFNSLNYTYEKAVGLTKAQADALYVKLSQNFQTITGNITVTGAFQASDIVALNGINTTNGITASQYNATTIPIASFNTNNIQYNFKDNTSGNSNGTGIASIKTASGGTGGGEDTRLKGYVKGTEVVRLQDNSVVSSSSVKSLSNQPVVWAMDKMTFPMTMTRAKEDIKIGFRRPPAPTNGQPADPEEPELYTGITCQYVIDASQRMGFVVAGNEGMYFDASNMIVSSTFRSNNNRAVSGDIGFRYLSGISNGWGDRFQFYDNSLGAGGFQQLGHWNYEGLGFYRPVYIGANELGRPTDANNYATGIRIVRKCPDTTFTFTTNNQSLDLVVSIGKTLPSADYVITMGIEETSANPEGQIGYSISNKTTSQFTINAHSLKIATFIFRPVLTLFV